MDLKEAYKNVYENLTVPTDKIPKSGPALKKYLQDLDAGRLTNSSSASSSTPTAKPSITPSKATPPTAQPPTLSAKPSITPSKATPPTAQPPTPTAKPIKPATPPMSGSIGSTKPSGSMPSTPFKSSRLNTALTGIQAGSWKTRSESHMKPQKYHSMFDAYRSVYEVKGYQEGGEVKPDKPTTQPSNPHMGIGLRAAVVLPKPSVTKVNIEVNPQETKIGDVDKAYYTYPAGFDPTNREDVSHPSANKKVEYKAEQNDISAGDLLDFIVESGIAETTESAEALYTHMSIEWMDSLIDGIIEEGKKGRCWTGHKPTPGKKAFSPGSCEKA